MRSDGYSLGRAAREAGTTPTTMRRYIGSALKRQANGRWRATPSDRLTRRLLMLTEEGNVEIVVRSSRAASRIASYMAAVDKYLKSGDDTALLAFEGMSVRSRGQSYEFITDIDALDRLAHAGQVSFERLYTMR